MNICICRNEIPFGKFEQGELTGDSEYLKMSFFSRKTTAFAKFLGFCSDVPGFLWKMRMLRHKTREIDYPFHKTRLKNHFRTKQMLSTRSKKTPDYWEKTPNFAQFFTNYWNFLNPDFIPNPTICTQHN